MPCTYSFSKITATEQLFSVLWLEVQISLQKAHDFVSAAPCTLDVCSQSVQASTRPSAGSKCCAHVLSVPGASVALASAGKESRSYQIRLFSPTIVGINFQTKGRSELYSQQWVLPILIVKEGPSGMCLHILLCISANAACVYFLFADTSTGYLEAFLYIRVLRHFHSVFESHSFHTCAYVISPRNLWEISEVCVYRKDARMYMLV